MEWIMEWNGVKKKKEEWNEMKWWMNSGKGIKLIINPAKDINGCLKEYNWLMVSEFGNLNIGEDSILI